MKVIAAQWAVEKGILPAGTKWWVEQWEWDKVIRKDYENCTGIIKTNCLQCAWEEDPI